MAIKKLSLEDFFEEASFTLIGIHTSIEDYRLAYLINSKLNINLKRRRKDLDFNNNSYYSIFEWEDNKQLVTWNLVSNICKIETTNKAIGNSLFKDNSKLTETFYLLPEHKKINFLLKINDEQLSPKRSHRIINNIQDIAHIVTAYQVDIDQLKSKNNLIFN
ncbi:IPExxxVDY family protein [Formosa maritima]|uniref:IPExxxVDY family protein n=1 Tax=Formosa maritima TaxID=2592046 RepID=A0A5D0GN52_9FLAO|nr:IPExxxVDY family protein [Formosa maritima]TYA60140.1 IPExxxVDY family protein [Formosa maritima]